MAASIHTRGKPLRFGKRGVGGRWVARSSSSISDSTNPSHHTSPQPVKAPPPPPKSAPPPQTPPKTAPHTAPPRTHLGSVAPVQGNPAPIESTPTADRALPQRIVVSGAIITSVGMPWTLNFLGGGGWVGGLPLRLGQEVGA
jgi:hypothetical protein